MDASEPSQLARYVPAHTLHRVARDPRPHPGAVVERLPAAVLFADISGFTALTERLAAASTNGAEALRDCLDAYFGPLVELVTDQGGDVVKFAGDALLAIWPAATASELPAAVLSALRGALAVQERFGTWAAPAHIAGDERLTVRLCVSAGELALTQLGGVLDRWEPLVLGAPLQHLAALKRGTEPGQVVVSESAAALVPGSIRLGTVSPVEGAHLVLGLEVEPPPASSPRRVEALALVPPAAVSAALRSYLPGVVLARLAAGQSAWLGELRRVAVLFAALPAAEDPSDEGIERAQAIVAAIQAVVYAVDGSINKVSVDEKGAVLVAAFGLPPLSHEDDPARAVHAALGIQKQLLAMGQRVRVGIATGTAFCGAVGSEGRAEYTMIGASVNLAARIMEHSDGILVDEITHASARSLHVFREGPTLQLKGKAVAAPTFQPTGEARLTVRPRTAMVGRTAERAVLSEAIQGLLRRGDSTAVVLVGEPGVGKSRLVDEAVEQAKRLGANVFVGAGDSIDRATPYRAWRAVFAQLFGDAAADGAALAAALEQPELAPLLDVVLPLELSETEVTRHMTGEARANKTQELLCRVLARSVGEHPLLVVLEDAHWFDTQSWALLVRVAAEVAPISLIVSSRPFGESVPPELGELRKLPTTATVQLEGLDFEDTRTLVRQRLAVRDVPDEVARLVFERGAGNALFSEELALALRDFGRVVVEGDALRIAVPVGELVKTALPETVKGVVTARVDRLDLASQLLLKVASVIGRTFERALLDDVLGTPGQLEPLVELDLVRPLGGERFLFKHALTQDAVYELMLVAQRRELHRKVAAWYEAHGRRDDPASWSVLAHHWEHAQERLQAVGYLERAGGQALESYANQEAVEAFERALAISPAEVLADGSRIGAWRRQLAEGQFRQGNLAACRVHGREALALLGRPLPGGILGQVGSLLRQVFVRMGQRWWPRPAPAAERESRLQATRVLNRITEVCIYGEDALGCLDSGLRELNTAEPAGPSAELGRAYAAMSIVLGTVPLHGICQAWTERALRVVTESGSPGAEAYVLSRVGVYDIYIARWVEGEARLRRAIEIAERIGDLRLREEAMAILAKTLFYSGRFRPSAQLWSAVRVSAQKSGSAQTGTWSLFGQAEALLRLGEAGTARPLLEAAREWTAQKGMASEVVWLEGLRALALLRTGEADAAREVAMGVLPKVAGVRPVAYWTQQSTAALAEVFITLWRRGDPGARKPALQVVKAMRAFAKTFPFGAAHAPLWTGVAQAAGGDTRAALESFEAAERAAERIGTPYEGARAALEVARIRGAGLAEARARLEALGAGFEAVDG